MDWSGCQDIPQGLKPLIYTPFYGTAEAVPLQDGYLCNQF